jgi:glyoxylase-like metal-dependent hydrolase (beta-lactamase superfamily II)
VQVAPTAAEQVQRLGFTVSDVTDIVVTHLDKDHAGGLADFPQATVHVHPFELGAALDRPTFIDRQRYLPAHFAHSPRWSAADPGKASQWRHFQRIPLPGLAGIALIHLPGHSAGHCGVLLEGQGRPLLHCGDAVYHAAWLNGARPPMAIQLVEQLLAHDRRAHASTIRRLQQLIAEDEVTVFCAHDPAAFVKLSSSV